MCKEGTKNKNLDSFSLINEYVKIMVISGGKVVLLHSIFMCINIFSGEEKGKFYGV